MVCTFALLAGVLGTLMLLAGPAAAAPPTTITRVGGGAGEVEHPSGVAVDQASGDVYVADRNNFRIDKFSASGDFLLSWGYGVADGKMLALQTCGPEASPPTSRCFGGALSEGAGALAPEDVAVEQSTGDVYVGDDDYRVEKFSASGQFLLMFGQGVDKTAGTSHPNLCTAANLTAGDTCGSGTPSTEVGTFSQAENLPIVIVGTPPNVHVWVGDQARVEQFNPSGEYVSQIVTPGGGETTSLAVDSSGDLYMPRLATNDVQKISAVSSGEFTLTFKGQTTAPIAYNASSATITTDLTALSTIGAGNVSVSGFYLTGWTVTFTGALADEDVEQMQASGGTPPVTVTTITEGGPESVVKLDPTGTTVLGRFDTGGKPETLTLDSAGDVYVGDDTEPYRIMEFDPFGTQIAQFGAGQVVAGPNGQVFAIDETAKALYVASRHSGSESAVQRFILPAPGPLVEGQHTEALGPKSVTLAAELSPEGHTTTYRFEYGESESYGQATTVTTLPGSAFSEETVAVPLTGLTPETTYHYRLVAEDSEGHVSDGPDSMFTTLPVVGIEGESVTAVTAESATLQAELDPFAAAAVWWVEYGATESYGASTPVQSLASGSSPLSASTFISGLAPAEVYHYRFVARDERNGTTYLAYGEDRTFTTQPSGLAFYLPDGRAWELVSPPTKVGHVVSPYEGIVEAADGGDALTYLSSEPIGSDPQGNRTFEFSQVMARHGEGGWSSEDMTTSYGTVESPKVGEGFEYRLFSPDLATSLVEPSDGLALSVEASERTPYLRDDAVQPPSYRPLVTGKEGYADVPVGTEFGGNLLAKDTGDVNFEGASADLSHDIIKSSVPLTAGAASGSLYEWAAGHLALVSVLPAGEGGTVVAGELGAGEKNIRATISEDGRYVFWRPSGVNGGLYVRDTSTGELARLDVVQLGAAGGGTVEPVFQGASADGSRAFFSDTQQLTANASETEADLYECEVTHQGGGLGCVLHDLTPEPSAGESAAVRGFLPGISGDGSYLYVIANGVLAAGGQAGQPNLYVLHYDSGAREWQTRFVATLSTKDENDWGGGEAGDVGVGVNNLSADSAPDGGYFAFMSQRGLTGYDNRDAVSGEPDEEVYLYNAVTEELSCASCNPSGARPEGIFDQSHGVGLGTAAMEVADPSANWQDRWVAASLPDPYRSGVERAARQARFVLDDGRVFFDSADALVSDDSNGVEDVYEYEPQRVGSCGSVTGAADIASTEGGCVALMSSGTSSKESAFLDASASGEDVFFLTAAQLSGQDVDSLNDIYDAHVCGEGWQCPSTFSSPPACTTTDSCRAAPSPQPEIFGAPSSQTFSGVGGLAPAPAPAVTVKVKAKPLTRAQKLAKALKACKLKPKPKRAACRARAKRRYGAKQRNTQTNRRRK